MSSSPSRKPFQKFGGGGGRGAFNKSKKGGKRKNNFLQNVKGYGKKGNYGRGTHIEEEEFNYFLGILSAQHANAGTVEEKVTMGNNVIAQTEGKEIHLSSNQVVCKVLENLLGFVDAEPLEKYFEVFGEGLRPVCSDGFSSHVLEKLLETAFIRAVGSSMEKAEDAPKPKKSRDAITELEYNTTHDFSEEHRTKCAAFVLRISKFLLNNLEDFVSDPSACFLLRTAILTLAGFYLPKRIVIKGKVIPTSDKYNGNLNDHRLGEFKLKNSLFKVPAEWTEVLKEFPGRLQLWPQFKEFPYNNRTSVLLQVICIALHTADKKALDSFGKKIVTETFIDVKVPKAASQNEDYKKGEANGNGVDEAKSESADEGKTSANVKEEDGDDDDKDKPSVFKSESATRLLESIIAVASPKLLKHITELFHGRVLSLANTKNGVFAVTRLINYITDKSEFEAIVDELIPHFEKFLQTNKANIVSSLSATCLRLKTRQAAFITALQNTLHCTASLGEDRPKAFFSCLFKLKPFEVLAYERKTYGSVFGSFIIQDILQFNKPIFLVNSILETPPKTLVEMFELPNGSYIADKFFVSPTIGEKSREKLVKALEGFYIDLAITQHGSRVIESLMKAANDYQKVAIAKELTSKENKLKGSTFGRILYNILKLETFKLSQEQWKAALAESTKKEKVVKKEKDAEPMETNEETEGTEAAAPTAAKVKKNKKSKKRPAS